MTDEEILQLRTQLMELEDANAELRKAMHAQTDTVLHYMKRAESSEAEVEILKGAINANVGLHNKVQQTDFLLLGVESAHLHRDHRPGDSRQECPVCILLMKRTVHDDRRG